MKPYDVHNEAKKRIAEIWRYSFFNFGKQQADKYVSDIKQTMVKIANETIFGKTFTKLSKTNLDLMHVKCNKHYIFYIIKSDSILVLTVLHGSMNILKQLNKIKI